MNIRTIILFIALCSSGATSAALPVALDGKQLPSLAPMLQKVTPAVVNIATHGTIRVQSNPLFQDPFFRRFFEMPDQPQEQHTQSLGSGVIVDAANGYILTNHHVIENANKVEVTLNDGRSYSATLIGNDPLADMAVIKIKADDLQQIPWSDSEQLLVGDFAVAIGNPFGLGQTVTSGIISALSRSGLGIEDYEDFIQTDASINPGNSGGALVNLRGELIGINTAILGSNGGNVGIGFAIPSNMARQIMEQLLEFGEVRRGRLGISIQNMTADLASSLGIKQNTGVIISDIESGSSAETAGLKVGDIIVSLGKRRVIGVSNIRNIIGLLRVGQTVKLGLIRKGSALNINATIGDRPQQMLQGYNVFPYLAGAEFKAREEKGRYQSLYYIYVSSIDRKSPAWSAGLREDDIILSVNRKRVKNLSDMQRLSKNSAELLLNIQRGRRAFFLLLK